jgi:hypothetical protein
MTPGIISTFHFGHNEIYSAEMVVNASKTIESKQPEDNASSQKKSSSSALNGSAASMEHTLPDLLRRRSWMESRWGRCTVLSCE